MIAFIMKYLLIGMWGRLFLYLRRQKLKIKINGVWALQEGVLTRPSPGGMARVIHHPILGVSGCSAGSVGTLKIFLGFWPKRSEPTQISQTSCGYLFVTFVTRIQSNTQCPANSTTCSQNQAIYYKCAIYILFRMIFFF